jgi:hypothetical protein
MSADAYIKELGTVAGWFARNIVANEFGAHPPRAVTMVGDPKLGWPTMEEAYATLHEHYGWPL